MARPIYRTQALQRHNNRLEQTAHPRAAEPPWALLSFCIVGLLLSVAALFWAVQIPVYVRAPGVIIRTPAALRQRAPLAVAVFASSNQAKGLQTEQTVRLDFAGLEADAAPAKEPHRVALVEPSVAAPATVRTRYGLDASSGLLVQGPVVVALVPLDGAPATHLGSVGEVQIEIGVRRGLLWWFGPAAWFDSDAREPLGGGWSKP